MAEGFLKSFDNGLDVSSAGTNPATRVHPKAIQVMREIGIDISMGYPKDVSRFIDRSFDFVITVCDHAREACPLFAGSVKERLHMGFEDPAHTAGTDEEVLLVFRRVRDQIGQDFHRFYEQRLMKTGERKS